MFSKTECNGLKIYADRLQVSLTMTHKYLPTIISEMLKIFYLSIVNKPTAACVCINTSLNKGTKGCILIPIYVTEFCFKYIMIKNVLENAFVALAYKHFGKMHNV